MNKLIPAALAAMALSATLAHAAGDPVAGKEKAAPCFACHAENGISVQPIYPHIGGQYADYLLHSLKEYKAGTRQNAIMQGMVAALTEQDMQDLAAYFAGLDGALKEGTVQP